MPFTLSFDTANAAGLASLDGFLKGRSYVIGFSATQKDAELFTAIGKAPDAKAYPHVARYFNHIASFSAEARAAFGSAGASSSAAAPAKGKAAAAAPKADNKDAEDLFGDDDDAAAKAAASVTKAATAEAPKKKEKKVVIAKTAVTYEVKPAETYEGEKQAAMMEELKKGVFSIAMDGLVWNQGAKIVDVAFGIQKLVVQAIVEDEKVNTQDVEDALALIKGGEDGATPLVQSVDQLSMDKAS